MLEKKEKVLLKKATAEVEKAKEFTRAKNKRGMWLNSCMHDMEKTIVPCNTMPPPFILSLIFLLLWTLLMLIWSKLAL